MITWEKREVVAELPDGWTIEELETKADRAAESQGVFQGRACITGGEWDARLNGGGYVLMSLRDPEGQPKATLLFGEADKVLEARSGHGYVPYFTAKAFDQHPRCFGEKALIALQCCPAGYMAGDTAERMEETKMVKAWYEALPKAENFDGWRCNDPDTRVAAAEFKKMREANA